MPFKGQRPSTPQWQHFHLEILKLNRHAPTNVVYKVFFLGRHGEGYHVCILRPSLEDHG